jgi:hypothetical protein
MVAFGPQTFTLLDTEARQRGISVQELLRAVIIPEWFKTHSDISFKTSGPVFKNKYGEARETVVSSTAVHQ